MPGLSANLTFLFAELPFLERLAAAAKAGFAGVEWMASYDILAETVRATLDALGLQAVLINAPAGDLAKGDRGLAGLPERIAESRASIATAIGYARVIDALGYDGWVGCEYRPIAGTLEGLGWAAKYLRDRR